MILSFALKNSPLISGTINFFVGSILQAEELSITVVPTAANFGAHSKDVSPPAEKIARSGVISRAVCNPTTVNSSPPKRIVFPIDFSEATGINSVIGKFCSLRTCNSTFPTIPVAPTIATLIVL